MRSVLFVCTANICRSPTAKGVLRSILARTRKGIAVEIDSAGTHDYRAGAPPFPTGVQVAKARGYDISDCVSRQIKLSDFDHFDHILAMDNVNLTNLKSIAPTRTRHKIELLLAYGDKYYGREVPDPYGGKEEDFRVALEMIEDGCTGLAKILVR